VGQGLIRTAVGADANADRQIAARETDRPASEGKFLSAPAHPPHRPQAGEQQRCANKDRRMVGHCWGRIALRTHSAIAERAIALATVVARIVIVKVVRSWRGRWCTGRCRRGRWRRSGCGGWLHTRAETEILSRATLALTQPCETVTSGPAFSTTGPNEAWATTAHVVWGTDEARVAKCIGGQYP